MATSSISSLDVPSLVSQLMSIERQPIDKLNTKITDYQSKISSFGTLSGLVSSFQTAVQGLKSSLEGYGATSADTNILSATAASTAAAGTYSINVTRLAQAQNLVAAGQASETIAISTADSTVTFTIGGTPMAVTITAGASLQQIRDSINGANLGLTASIINDGSGTPYRLVLTANKTGASNGVSSIAVSGDAAVGSLLTYGAVGSTVTQSAAAQDASFAVNGIAITSATNTVTGAIQGVTLTLKAPTATATTLTVARDTSAIDAAAAKFVESYNALATQLKSRSAFGSATTAGGVLAGDNTVRQMLDQLRGIFMTPASGGTFSYLAEIGITTQAGGTLKLDSSKFGQALSGNFSDVANLFNGATGFATRLAAWTTSMTETGGVIAQRTQSLNTSIKGYNELIDRLEIRMKALQRQYTTTYSNLNMMLTSMNDTSNYLTSQFS